MEKFTMNFTISHVMNLENRSLSAQLQINYICTYLSGSTINKQTLKLYCKNAKPTLCLYNTNTILIPLQSKIILL